MLSKKMEEALNKLINEEFWSGYLYLSMSAYFENKNLRGFANWMRIQYQEEVTHALKIYDYVNTRGGKVILKSIHDVATDWKDVTKVFEETYKHEQTVTNNINKVVTMAKDTDDHATFNVLQWFVAEQVEEESSANELLEQLKMLNGNAHGLFMLDRELKERVFVDSTKEK